MKISKCEKCGKVIAEPKELIRITQNLVYHAFWKILGYSGSWTDDDFDSSISCALSRSTYSYS